MTMQDTKTEFETVRHDIETTYCDECGAELGPADDTDPHVLAVNPSVAGGTIDTAHLRDDLQARFDELANPVRGDDFRDILADTFTDVNGEITELGGEHWVMMGMQGYEVLTGSQITTALRDVLDGDTDDYHTEPYLSVDATDELCATCAAAHAPGTEPADLEAPDAPLVERDLSPDTTATTGDADTEAADVVIWTLLGGALAASFMVLATAAGVSAASAIGLVGLTCFIAATVAIAIGI